ncbi:VanZ family protein [Paenibacillus sp. IHBB 3054]|uniref:VanZ family protein n=1 Tax=Paenibacillus sp. IHBB 3054 TaxID=3425689 RepID=UPI003F67AAA6
MNDLLGYFIIGGIIIGALAILYLPVFFLLRRRVNVIRQLCFLLFAACGFIVLYATIISAWGEEAFHPAQHHLNLIPLRWLNESGGMSPDKAIVQVYANIIMFIPCGFFVPSVFSWARAFGRTALVIFCWSFFIEFSQYFIGASADIDDIILNLLGGILGYAVFAFLSLCFQRTSGWEKLLGSENNRQKKNSIQTIWMQNSGRSNDD